MSTLSFRSLTPDNYRAVFGLKVAPEQEHFVANNVYSVAQAKVFPNFVPLAIYADETAVGFIMYELEGHEFYISRYMVGADHQRQGYGRAALSLILEQFRADPACHTVALSYEPENTVAAALYASLGFVETGELDEGETVARLNVKREA